MDDLERTVRAEGRPTPPAAVERAEKALAAIDADYPLHLNAEDAEYGLSDVLADLMHWAESREVDWTRAAARGRRHYEAERG